MNKIMDNYKAFAKANDTKVRANNPIPGPSTKQSFLCLGRMTSIALKTPTRDAIAKYKEN